MKINEEIYRSIIAPKEESDRNIVPLEEVLLIDEAAMRRDLIMNVLNDDPENYIDMLKQARMNDDVEVVHYAITGMVELSKEYESRLQKIEYRYAKKPEINSLFQSTVISSGVFISGTSRRTDGTGAKKSIYKTSEEKTEI